MTAYRDSIDILRDLSADGDPVPDHDGIEAAVYEAVPCAIRITAGDATYRGRQLEARATHVIELRALPGIVASMRVAVRGGFLAGRSLNITHVRPLDQRGSRVAGLELYCEELAAT